MRRLLFLCCGLLALLLLAAAAPLAAQSGDTLPAPHLGYGVHVGPHLNTPADMVRALGMDWVKVYDVAQVDDYPGLRVLFRLDLDWPTDWEYFRQDVARRVRELVALGVDAIEVHNEPNLALEWPHGPNAWEYVQMLRLAYQAIKAADPAVIVVSGGLAPTLTTPDRRAINDLDFAREMLDNGAAQYFDAFGYHPYGFDQPPEADPAAHELTFRRAERLYALLESYGLGDKPVWLTEFGWLRDPAESGMNCQGDPALAGFEWMRVPLATQAEYTVRAFAYADRYWPWAGPMFLWNLNWQMYGTDIEPACSHLRWFSLLESDGTPTDTYRAVAAMPRRVSAYRPRLETRPLLLPGQTLSAGNVPTYPLAAFCPNAVAVGEFQIVNTGWPAQITIAVEPAALDAPGMPGVAVSAVQARFGDRVTLYADASDTPPGVYLLVVNLRATFEGRLLSGNARVLLQIENSPINCPA